MPKKQSYMNRESILSEGFFDKIFRTFKEFKKISKDKKDNMKIDKKLKGHIKSLNKSTNDIEKYFKSAYGVDVDLDGICDDEDACFSLGESHLMYYLDGSIAESPYIGGYDRCGECNGDGFIDDDGVGCGFEAVGNLGKIDLNWNKPFRFDDPDEASTSSSGSSGSSGRSGRSG